MTELVTLKNCNSYFLTLVLVLEWYWNEEFEYITYNYEPFLIFFLFEWVMRITTSINNDYT